MKLTITKGAVNDIEVVINSTDVIVQQANNISVEVTPVASQTINIDRGLIGPTGPQGPQGTPGEGVPTGGTSGQILYKTSNADYATDWESIGSMAFQNSNNVAITGGTATGLTNLESDYLQLDTAAATAIALGKLRWNADTATAAFGIIDGTVECNIGEQVYAYVTNADSVTIQKGQPVYLYRATGNRASVKLASNLGDATSAKTLGLATQSIAPNQIGFITTQGVLDKIDTSAFAEGDTLYLGATAGTLTNVKPKAPNHLVYMGVVERANNGNGQIYVRPQNGYELDEIHDVQINSPSNGQTILYDASTSLWKNANLTAGTGISVTNGAASATITNTAPDQTVVMNSGTGISVTGTYPNFTVTNTSPSSGGTVTSVGGTGTVSGIALSGTVTSSGNLTLGGALDLSSPPAIGATTPSTGAFTTATASTQARVATSWDKGTGVLQVTGNSAFDGTVVDKQVVVAGGNNLLTYSQDFTNAIWVSGGSIAITTTGDSTTAPDGTITADTLNEGAGTGSRFISQTLTLANNTVYTMSGYFKANTATSIQITGGSVLFGSNLWATFNLSNGTVGASGTANISTSITSVGNGWYKCSITGTTIASGSGTTMIVVMVNSPTAVRVPSYTGSSNTLYVWGTQLEASNTATPYTPTTTTAVSTINDVYIPTGAVRNGTWNQGTGSLQITGNTSVNGSSVNKNIVLAGGNNLVLYSQDQTQASWTKSNTTTTGSATTAPDGTSTAVKLIASATTSTHYASQDITFNNTGSGTYSLYVKAAEYTTGRIAIVGLTTPFPEIDLDFNLTTATVTTAGSTIVSSSISNVGNGWYRVTLTGYTGQNGSHRVYIYPNLSSSYTGNGTSGIYIWGAQLETGTVASAYTATTSAAVSATNQVLAPVSSASSPVYCFMGNLTTGAYGGSSVYGIAINGVRKLEMDGSNVYSYAPIYVNGTYLTSDSANTLAQRNSTNAQTYNLYNTYTDASNYERLAIYWSGNISYIRSQWAGTGTNRALSIISGSNLNIGAGDAIRWGITNTTGYPISPSVDASYDFGTSANRIRTYYGSGGMQLGLVSKTANYTLTVNDYTVLGDATGGAITLTLPTAVGYTGKIFVLKRINSGANAVTVNTTSSQTIDGSTTYSLSAQYATVTVQSDGANWQIISKF